MDDPLYTATTTPSTGKKSRLRLGGGGGGGGGTAKYGKKMEEGLVKTKEVAVTGMKKIKAGASVGFGWVKDKYHKTTQKR
ncbi:5' exonuclease Apollo [Ancistrocladus abbreviatus]